MRGAGVASRGLLAVALLAGVGLASHAGADQWTFQTGARLDYYSADKQSGQGDGGEFLIPYGLWYDAPNWGIGGRGTWGRSWHDLDQAPKAEIEGFADTTVSGYVRFNLSGTELRIDLDVDVPTGVSALKNSQLPAVQDEDLAAIQRFGEGLDINPTVTVYRSFGDWGLGAGVGYLMRGKYDPTRNVPGDDFDPADELTGSVLGDVIVGESTRLVGRFAYTYFTTDDERGGIKTFRPGDELDVTVGLEWRPEPWWLAVTVRDIYRFKAERLNPGGLVRTEAQNNYGNEIRGNLTVGYIIDDVWTVGGTVDVRYVAANDYPTGDPLHDGGRLKVAVGPWVTWTFSRRFAVDVSARYFHLDAKQSPVYPKDSNFDGVQADLRLTYRF